MPKISILCRSEAGGHEANEDAQRTSVHPQDPWCHVCAVADGQGGRAGGREAAILAVTHAVDLACAQPPASLTSGNRWVEILSRTDAAVEATPEAGFTTLVALAVLPDSVAGASSGDSAVLLLVGNEH